MSTEVKIPAVGESITSGVLSGWLKQNGDAVQDGEPIFSLETDKISTEVPSPASGTLQIMVAAGEEVKIGQIVAMIDAVGSTSKSEPKEAAPEATAIPSPKREKDAQQEPALTPAVRRLVAEEKIPLAEVTGTGKHGQVTKEDLINYLERPAQKETEDSSSEAPAKGEPEPALKTVPAPESKTADASAPVSTDGRSLRRKMSPLRKKIAAQLVMAQQNAAMLTTFNECDMSAVMHLRSSYQEAFQKRHGTKLGFMSFFIKAVVDALHLVTAMNARIDGDDLVENHYYDIGVAVGTERGLVVPVVRDADKKSFAELENSVGAFAAKARDGKLQLDELTGGVFTITNGGIYGSLLSTPILNPPQSGILGMHKIQERPVAIGGKIEIRPMMYLALSYDHRVVDGKEAVTFLVRVKECIEDPTRLLLQG
ncbi:MAG: 2-oxoglutarate dehydrogenase complex dihydrolipoyllysine-residue succinyltransferase [Verrucomicrobia bacterium]|nr:2-oxoglutarate dehydrogenase complex dihydrolipoyllysine-residue succinyltransferase [Verrucomicrobiota bacterium]